MTYAELKAILNTFTSEELDKPVTMLLLDAGDFVNPYEHQPIVFSDDTDDLPNGTPYFLI